MKFVAFFYVTVPYFNASVVISHETILILVIHVVKFLIRSTSIGNQDVAQDQMLYLPLHRVFRI